MANPFKTFVKALLGRDKKEDEREIKNAERLGEIVANNAEISIGVRRKIHIDADAARKAAEETAKRKKARGVDKGTER